MSQSPTPTTERPGTPVPGAVDPTAGTAAADVAATFCATLVDEWVRLGVTDAVVSPGSRSTPLALAMADSAAVRVHVVHDERSAAFTALGLGVATRRPALLLCTSGTAAANFHPAVVEAHQAAVPMVVVTADRPPELQGVGAPQTIDQRHLFGSAVRWYCEPGPAAADGAPWWRDLARDSLRRSLGTTPGPVHLNLAFREPLVGTAGALPPPGADRAGATVVGASGAAWGLVDEELGRTLAAVSGRRGLIVAGARTAMTAADADAVLALADTLGWPVLADAPSGCRRTHPRVVTTADALLRHDGFADAHRPEFVLRLGALHSSRVLGEWLARSGAVQVGIDRHGLVPDPDHVLSWSRPADPAEVCRQLAGARTEPAPLEWTRAWADAETTARRTLDEALGAGGAATEPTTALDALAAVPAGGVLVVSSSMPVRDLEWFAPARDDVRVVANRGANGIDGVTSTAVGVALTWTPTVLLTGDVAFLHDTNALIGLRRRGVPLVVVVVDNDGGGIFSFLPQADALEPERFEQLFGTPHGIDVAAVAEAHGVAAERVTSRAGLRAAINGAFTRGGVRVVAVTSDRAANVAVHRDLFSRVADALDELATGADPTIGGADGGGFGNVAG
ncbi:MAG: 2-succinyl-5-enolpyruvyl-6-hydroxy-3-cyclohexene-1-carboxylic-acid synthase [Acidimicrobiales bacterium]